MKFSHSLKFNAVPEWQDHYLNYPALKKVIYLAEQNQLDNHEPSDGSVLVNRALISDLVRIVRRNQALLDKRETDAAAAAELTDDDEVAVEKLSASKIINKFKNRKASKSVDTEKEVTHDLSKTGDVDVYLLDLENSTIAASLELDVWEAAARTVHCNSPNDPLPIFTKDLIEELTKIDKFFKSKEAEIYKQYDNLMKDLEANKSHIDNHLFTQAYSAQEPGVYESNEHRHFNMKSTLERTTTNASVFDTVNHLDQDIEKGYIDEEDEEDDDDDDDDHHSAFNSALLGKDDFDIDKQKRIALKQRSVHLFISLSELKSFIELNKIGLTKICKKFDKTCNYAVKEDFVNNFLPNNSRAFFPETSEKLDYRIDHMVQVYAFLSGRYIAESPQSLDTVRDELKSYLRDHIVWERNTVWKDLLSLEKKNYNLHLDENAVRSSKMGDEGFLTTLMHMQLKTIHLPFGMTIFGRDQFQAPQFLFTSQMIKITLVIIVFIVLMTVSTMNDKEEARCLAVLATVALSWATEALPLYITAMMVPLLVVSCKVLKATDGDGAMDAASASLYILGQMWSSTIMVLLAGFTLAAALSKYNVAKVVSSFMLAIAGTKPRNVLLAIMSVALFLSMWISNVAAPVLAYSLIQPVLRTLPTESPFAQALVLGIAFASNIGGMASPIASPQNIIAIEYMSPNPGWGKWFAVAIPVSICSLLGIWMELILTFKISTSKVKAYKPITDKLTTKQIFVSVVTIATIILWCIESQIEDTFGSSGIIAVFPIVILFGTGILKVDDINNFPWSVILLAMGGLALGKAVTSSGLLATIATALQEKVMDLGTFAILVIFGLLILVVATFVSHTVATIIIVPLVKEVGDAMSDPHPLLLIMGTALIASGAMALPTSGFPNVTAISMTDEVGKRYLSVSTFITRGIPASVIAYIFIITVGYGVMSALSF
ncbi:SPX-domain-containing protein [Metschnikowia bicuspidata var. bicuspidata NRRL YB-4993]|uniref:SPX-domain-containing protein n=1 Tax=Metschnikowia bicuspidata var. bicuspidata NRRL YB-4993 TaxID=869754 RepID=A0A1A0HKD1_9ASCO|nr:SPX-domain-containing protein [Metschnikowia bicuspidata var. bicuspidata NRRL YB-4993]OBA24461.1 SPX-domain-containing protein [Metschnikowia bicuspidata var. bicuspidata NRRL YB-4993]